MEVGNKATPDLPAGSLPNIINTRLTPRFLRGARLALGKKSQS